MRSWSASTPSRWTTCAPWSTSCGRPVGCPRPASARTRTRSAPPSKAWRAAGPPPTWGRPRGRPVMVRAAVGGAAGRMGATACGAVEGAEDMELTGRADPTLGTSIQDVLGDADVLVDFTLPDQVVANARTAAHAGVHVVIGATGWAEGDLREAVAGAPGKVFSAPNFAV